jgi:hypothetical protein
MEERDNPRLPGLVLIVTANGIACRHPSTPAMGVIAFYSERRPEGQRALLDPGVSPIGEDFLRSLTFLP